MTVNRETPFTYPDERQERNQSGHEAQWAFFEAAEKGEGPGGIEFKQDRVRDRTGNWFVELYGNQLERSGLATTQAHWWLMCSPLGHAILLTVAELREYIIYASGGAWPGAAALVPGCESSRGFLLKDDGADFFKWKAEQIVLDKLQHS